MKSKRIRSTTAIQERARELRQSSTLAEKALWKRLRNRQLSGFKFRRQHPIERFIVDFYCAEARLVIEIDGGIHKTQVEADTVRSDVLAERGYRVIRFTNEQVIKGIDQVLSIIQSVCLASSPLPQAGEGQG
jgi:very-short-patch-repair endonuclease